MTSGIGRLLLGAALGLWLGGAALAGSLVEFPNVSESEPKLLAYLARPEGAGPFPAVVVLHGCSGFSSAGSLQLADQLKDWGYVALTVDALRYLSQQSFVAPERVAVLGNSMGGYAALYAVDRDLMAQHFRRFKERFRAAIAYYPSCGIPATIMTAPALILIGTADDWTPAERCREMVAHARPESAPIALTVYPGAYHGFNFAMLTPGRSSRGHWLEYNEAAAKDAEEKVRTFLATNLANVPTEKAATQWAVARNA
jgi:dienelactone hydrolase